MKLGGVLAEAGTKAPDLRERVRKIIFEADDHGMYDDQIHGPGMPDAQDFLAIWDWWLGRWSSMSALSSEMLCMGLNF